MIRNLFLVLLVLILPCSALARPVAWWSFDEGKGTHKSKQLTHIARGVYSLTLPPQPNDLEYYIQAQISTGNIVCPLTAPNLNQTVIIIK